MSDREPAGGDVLGWAAAVDAGLVRRLLARRARPSRPVQRAANRLAMAGRCAPLSARLGRRARLLEEDGAQPELPVVRPLGVPAETSTARALVAPRGAPQPVAQADGPAPAVASSPVALPQRGASPRPPLPPVTTAGRSRPSEVVPARAPGRRPRTPRVLALPAPAVVAAASSAGPQAPGHATPASPRAPGAAGTPGPSGTAPKEAPPTSGTGPVDPVRRRPVVRPRPAPTPPAPARGRGVAVPDLVPAVPLGPLGPRGRRGLAGPLPASAGGPPSEPAPAVAPPGAAAAPRSSTGPAQPLRPGADAGGGTSAEELVEHVLRRLDREFTVAAERRGRRPGEWRGGPRL